MNKIKYLLLPALIIPVCITVSACSARDSGLYRVTVSDGEEVTDGDTGSDVSDDSGRKTDTGGTKSIPGDSAGDTENYGSGVSGDKVKSESGFSGGDSENGQGFSGDDSENSGIISGEAADTALYVHVCGAVIVPGVYEMLPGDRIYQAIDKAGGFADGADRDYVNLAMQVSDGMKITVPTLEESAAMGADGGTEAFAAIEYASDGSDTSGQGDGDAGLIDINTADREKLMTIPGIGASKAEAVIRYREEHGGFSSVDEIMNVSGIGEATFNRIKDIITIGIK